MAKTTTAAVDTTALPRAPKPRTSDKGEPPKSLNETTALTNYTKTPAKTAKVGLNTEVTAEFRAELKVWAAQHGYKMGEALQKGFELLKEKHR